MRSISVLFVMLSAASAFGACPAGGPVPCYAIEYRQQLWDHLDSFFGTTLSTYKGMKAVRSDGSVASSYEPAVCPAGMGTCWLRTSVYSKQEERVYESSGPKSEVRTRTPDWQDRVQRVNSTFPDCDANLPWVPNPRKIGTGTILGIPVVKWTSTRGLEQVELDVAPSLNCEVLREHRLTRNYWGFPTHVYEYDVVRMTTGEPPAALFTVPAGPMLQTSSPVLDRVSDILFPTSRLR